MDKKQKGFTLIELLVVMAIIGLLASIVMISLKGAIEKARMVKVLKFSQGIQNVLGADIVLNLSFDDQKNPTKDASGYGNNGSITGTGGFTDDTPHKFVGAGVAQGKYALYFDGDDYVDCGNDPSLNPTPELTFEAWAKPTGTLSAWASLVQRKLVGHWCDAVLGVNDANQWQFTVSDGTTWVGATGPAPQIGIWQHSVGTYSGGTLKLYLNGELKDTKSITKTTGTVENVFIGRYLDGGLNSYFNGSIDEVRVYSRALTAFEIQKHYVEGTSRHGIVLK